MERDREHKLYLLYPQGNWVEVGQGTPYYLIGESSFGKPILDRALTYESSIETALKIGYLAFDATRTSASDVDFPIDVVIYEKDTYAVVEERYERQSLIHISEWWQDRIKGSVSEISSDWIRDALSKIPKKTDVEVR